MFSWNQETKKTRNEVVIITSGQLAAALALILEKLFFLKMSTDI